MEIHRSDDTDSVICLRDVLVSALFCLGLVFKYLVIGYCS